MFNSMYSLSDVVTNMYILWILPAFSICEGVFECIDEKSGRCLAKIRDCQRFDGLVISRNSFRTLERCLNYARERNALAFNYSPPEAANVRKNQQDYVSNCQIFSCPDIGLTNMVNDSGYDYYSMYTNLSQEAICIKSVGMFYLLEEKRNYIDSISACQSMGGDLANVVSEARTNSLSLLLSNRLSDWQKVAYVGLDDRKYEGRFVTSTGNHLSCYKYRAWGPSQPRSQYRHEDCVLLDTARIWRVVNCRLKFPALCEIYPDTSCSQKEQTKRVLDLLNPRRFLTEEEIAKNDNTLSISSEEAGVFNNMNAIS